MDLKKFATMDINMLLSVVNMQLRDRYDDLDDLCKAQEIRSGSTGSAARQRRFSLPASAETVQIKRASGIGITAPVKALALR